MPWATLKSRSNIIKYKLKKMSQEKGAYEVRGQQGVCLSITWGLSVHVPAQCSP